MTLGSTPDWFHLGDDEDIVWESRPHPIAMGSGLPIGIGVLLGGVLLTAWSASNGIDPLTVVGVVVTLVGLGVVGVRYLVWTNTRYVITTSELYKKHGVVSRDVTQFRLDRIQNTSLQQSTLGRVLNYGNLTVYTAGSGEPELTFEQVPGPDRASSVLSDQLGRTAGGSDRDQAAV